MSTIRNTKEKKIGKINIFFVLLLFGLFFIHNELKAQSKTWTAFVNATNIKNPLAGNTETVKYAYKKTITPLICCVKSIKERKIRRMS
jgi:hypothetical protein